MPRPRRNRSSVPAFPELPSNIQIGLKCLVSDNASTIAQMLDTTTSSSSNDNDDGILNLCEKCALVMKQQQLSPALFLARFFDASMLVNHVTLLGKSAKGSAPVLAERIAKEWTKGNVPPTKEEKIVTNKGRPHADGNGSNDSDPNNKEDNVAGNNHVVKKPKGKKKNESLITSPSSQTKRSKESQTECEEDQTRKKKKK